jgi:hypothetical protein
VTEPADEAEIQRWHRRFAVACNNRAWELSVQARDLSQDRELLDAAHAAAWHWGKIGTELNHMRATLLLAEVHALLGMGPSALAFAETARDYYLGRETADWELALVHAIHAHAAHADGRSATHREAYARAGAAVAAIASEEDRKIVVATFSQVPRPA